MAVINSCCCWNSLRKGSFACAIYTLIYYALLVFGGAFGIEHWDPTWGNSTDSLAKTLGQNSGEETYAVRITVIAFSGLTVLASVILLIGLCVNNRVLLLPWIVALSMTTVGDCTFTIYLLGTAQTFNPLFAIVFTMDFFICLLNVYCILCVISQYQEYREGRGRAWDPGIVLQIPPPYSVCAREVPILAKKPAFFENGITSNELRPHNYQAQRRLTEPTEAEDISIPGIDSNDAMDTILVETSEAVTLEECLPMKHLDVEQTNYNNSVDDIQQRPSNGGKPKLKHVKFHLDESQDASTIYKISDRGTDSADPLSSSKDDLTIPIEEFASSIVNPPTSTAYTEKLSR